MAESLAVKSHKRLRLLGNNLWGVIDLATLKPCREPVETNKATSFVLECALQTLSEMHREELPTGFVGVAGESRFLRTQFPESLLSIISENVSLMVRTLVAHRSESPVSISGDQYRILLVILPDRDRVRTWIGAQTGLTQDDQIPHQKEQPNLTGLVTEALREIPADYEGRFRVLKTFQDQVRMEVASLLQPVLQQQADSMPIETYVQKQTVSTWVNSQLRELGLAIRCPHTGRPAILVADLRDAETQSSRFRYAIRDEEGRPTKTVSSKQLPDMELMVDEPRLESRAKGPTAGRLPRSK